MLAEIPRLYTQTESPMDAVVAILAATAIAYAVYFIALACGLLPSDTHEKDERP